MVQTVLLRHGESTWNRQNRFTGWTDVELSPTGVEEARRAGRLLREHGFRFDAAYTSVLARAIHTLWIVLDEIRQMDVPVIRAWQLNERHYGALQGLNKQEVASQYGADQFHRWRRGFTDRPPPLADDDPRHPRFDRLYAHLDPAQLPATESLQDTYNRAIPYWQTEIVPRLRRGQRVLVAAHGNSLRALVKYLDHIDDQAIAELNIPTGIPLVYAFDAALAVTGRHYIEDKLPPYAHRTGAPAA